MHEHQNQPKRPPGLPRGVEAHGKTRGQDSSHSHEIDANLKRVYAASLDAQIPDRFAQLLQQLRDKEGGA